MAAIKLFHGESKTIKVGPFTDELGATVDPGDATAIEFQVKQAIGLEDGVLLEKTLGAGITAAGGLVVIEIDSGDIGVGDYYYDLWVVIGGKRLLAVAPSRFVVKPVVNQP